MIWRTENEFYMLWKVIQHRNVFVAIHCGTAFGGMSNQQHTAAAGTAAIANKSGQTQTDKHERANTNPNGRMRTKILLTASDR